MVFGQPLLQGLAQQQSLIRIIGKVALAHRGSPAASCWNHLMPIPQQPCFSDSQLGSDGWPTAGPAGKCAVAARTPRIPPSPALTTANTPGFVPHKPLYVQIVTSRPERGGSVCSMLAGFLPPEVGRVMAVVVPACHSVCDWSGRAWPRWSEVVGGGGLVVMVSVDACWAVTGRDVAETALPPQRYPPRWFVAREPSDERAEVLDERVVHSVRRYADCVVAVRDLRRSLAFRYGSSALGTAYR